MPAQVISAGSLSRTRERVRVRARALRSTSPDAERKLWSHLRDRRLAGLKFRRQHPVGRYFADFACIEAKLVVELDGGQHFELEAMQADVRRSAELSAAGFHVLRFDDRQALVETSSVLQVILDWLQANHPHAHLQCAPGLASPGRSGGPPHAARKTTLTPTLSRKRERE